MPDIDDWAKQRAGETDKLRDANHTLQQRLRASETQRRQLEAQNAELSELLDRFSVAKPEDARTPKWLKPKKAAGDKRAMGVLLLSDLHLDEVVDRHEMEGVNEFNREIAHQRYERVINKAAEELKSVRSVAIEGLVIVHNGDIITGSIHDELDRTNEAPPAASIAHWVPTLASGVQYLQEEFDAPVHVPCKSGNHDRFYGKKPSKQRAESSLSWVIYNWMADSLRDNAAVTFDISPSDESLVDVYDTTFLLQHGDDFRSYGGVGGLYPAMLKWLLRKHDYYSQVKRDFDYALLGHWHQDLWGQDFVVNNTIKGYDQYARSGGFKWSRPSQQAFLVTPERGMYHRITVHAD